MTEKNEIYENSNMNTESSLLELLNNADKIIHRGQIEKELGDFSQTVNKTVTSAQNFFSHINDQTTIISAMIYTIMLLSVAYMIYSFYNKKIDSVFFVTILSILILYRDRMNTMVLQLSDFIESNGRGSALLKYFKEMEEGYDEVNSRVYENSDLDFNNITFDKASFGYSSSDTTIFNDMSISIETSGQKIIGMTGKSGRGKSTFVKLMLKIYRLTSGNIYIDDVNINDIDPDYIRKNIVYINQSGKLFDKVVIDNMLYACDDDEICKDRLEEIMSYEKIRDLYKNVDLNSNESGSLGENLSGGQRQIVNLINGLVHPSKILILDEPTNALDGELKRTVIKLIRDFKKYKKCIFIITHDSEMNSLFDETLKL
jgi:ABC-type bacteriocin/lantibiotic exporter with double-glycine peptidase domain